MQGIHYDFCLRHLEPNCMGVEYDIEISSTPQKQLLFGHSYEMVAQKLRKSDKDTKPITFEAPVDVNTCL